MFKCILIDNLIYSVKCERLMSKKDKLELSISSIREKGRDLTQSYDKSPYTNRNVKRAN